MDRQTLLSHGARPTDHPTSPVNFPPERASTYIFDSAERMHGDVEAARNGERVRVYGRRGTASSHALADLLTELEGGHRAWLYSSGLAAIAGVYAALLAPGDHVVLLSGAYGPAAALLRGRLTPLGVRVDFARDVDHAARLIHTSTKLVWAESPSSNHYEVIDLPALAGECRKHGAMLAVDNTWGSAWLCHPLKLGADICVLACTKYVVGHSDASIGATVCNERAWPAIYGHATDTGQCAGSEEVYLALRGIRTLAPRLQLHGASARELASWAQEIPTVSRVYCPALPSHTSHALWQRDCSGTNGLVTLSLAQRDAAAVDRVADALKLFANGHSWGGFESLALAVPSEDGTATDLRLHVGLEAVEDLKADLHSALREVFGA